MGKGDKRTRRGKIFAGSYGKTRQRPKAAAFVASPKSAAPSAPVTKEKPKPKIKKKAAAAEEPLVETTASQADVELAPEAQTEPVAEEIASEEGAALQPEIRSEARAEQDSEAPTENANEAASGE